MTASLHHRETADGYWCEIFRHGSFRVILCKDGIQWILQRRKAAAGTRAGTRWTALAYCTTRAALQHAWTLLSGGEAKEIEALPERIRCADCEWA